MSYETGIKTPETLPFLSTKDLELRQKWESNPSCYEVRMKDKSESARARVMKEARTSSESSCVIDLRPNAKEGTEKYGIWIGTDHRSLSYSAGFTGDPSMKDYYIGLRFFCDKNTRKIRIKRESIRNGNPSERTDIQIEAISKAAEKALQEVIMPTEEILIEDILTKCALQDHLLSRTGPMVFVSPTIDTFIAAAKANLQGDITGVHTTDEVLAGKHNETIQYICIPNIGELYTDKDSMSLIAKIDLLTEKLLQKDSASIRIGFFTPTGTEQDLNGIYQRMQALSLELSTGEERKEINSWVAESREVYGEADEDDCSRLLGTECVLIIERCL